MIGRQKEGILGIDSHSGAVVVFPTKQYPPNDALITPKLTPAGHNLPVGFRKYLPHGPNSPDPSPCIKITEFGDLNRRSCIGIVDGDSSRSANCFIMGCPLSM